MTEQKELKEQIEQIEDIIEEDLSNGKSISGRVKRKLIKKGYNMRKVCEQLEELKEAS